nr:MAG TPA: hypothetical protein [Caudoviricetes sp.]
MYANISLNEREKALITIAALQDLQGLKTDWTEIYLLSRDKPVLKIPQSPNIKTTASAWTRQAKVQSFYQTERERLNIWISKLVDSETNERIRSYQSQNPRPEDDPEGENNADSGNNVNDEGNEGEAKPLGLVKYNKNIKNYADRDTAIQALVTIANNAKDDKTKLDTIKAISDLQQFKEQAKKEVNEIKRFYMPLRCSECELYKRQRDILQESTK